MKSQSGFTLLEVLIASSLTAVLVTAATSLWLKTTRTMNDVKANAEIELAAADALRLMSDAVAKRYSAPTGTASWFFFGAAPCFGLAVNQRSYDAAGNPIFRLVVIDNVVLSGRSKVRITRYSGLPVAATVVPANGGASTWYPDPTDMFSWQRICFSANASATDGIVATIDAHSIGRNSQLQHDFGQRIYFPTNDRNPATELQ